MALQGLTLLIQHRLLAEARHYCDVVELRIAPPLCPVLASPADFSHTADLIDRAYHSAQTWLADPGDPGSPILLAPHPHHTQPITS
jgi:NTE family protein